MLAVAELMAHCPEKKNASYHYFNQEFNLTEALSYAKTNAEIAKDLIDNSGMPILSAAQFQEAADQVKAAMIKCWKVGYLPMLQIHDELCFNVESEEDEIIIQKAMEHNEDINLTVPSKVDKAIGNNWGEAS